VNDQFARVDPSSLASNLALACEVAPQASSLQILRTWAAFNNGVVDQMPIIGELMPGVIFGTFPYLGFTAGPIMGRTLAALALDRDPGVDISPYTPHRFAGLGVR
jgi:glycine/D-amino acid oxidase-like deaminating enzyme